MSAALLAGCRVLVVEDEYLIAEDVRRDLERHGATVVGPAPSVERAMRLIRSEPKIDAAVLDINLGGESSLPVASALRDHAIPFLFATGYAASDVPSGWRHVPCVEKPLQISAVAQLVCGQGSSAT